MHRFYWDGVAQMGRMIRCFRSDGVRRAVMAGKVHKVAMYQPWRLLRLLPDWRIPAVLVSCRAATTSDDTLLLGIIEEFAAEGHSLRFRPGPLPGVACAFRSVDPSCADRP